jgi:signal transduction histidine kinase
LERRFPAEVEITAYRIIQEALTNVARHARVNEAAVRLWSAREIMGIQVADKGCGFERTVRESDKTSGGLAGMQERISLLGGDWSIETTPGTGTCITVELPIAGQRVE